MIDFIVNYADYFVVCAIFLSIANLLCRFAAVLDIGEKFEGVFLIAILFLQPVANILLAIGVLGVALRLQHVTNVLVAVLVHLGAAPAQYVSLFI